MKLITLLLEAFTKLLDFWERRKIERAAQNELLLKQREQKDKAAKDADKLKKDISSLSDADYAKRMRDATIK